MMAFCTPRAAPGGPGIIAEAAERTGGQVHEQTRWFRARSVLGAFKPADLASAIAMGDKATIRRAPGVGPKVAERIVTELKDKAPAYAALDPAVIRLSGAVAEKRAPQPVIDAVSALVNLGYGQPQAAAAIAAASRDAGEGAATAQLIRLGLKELSK